MYGWIIPQEFVPKHLSKIGRVTHMTGMDLHLTDAEKAGLIAVLKREIADVTVRKPDGGMVLGPREGPLASRRRWGSGSP